MSSAELTTATCTTDTEICERCREYIDEKCPKEMKKHDHEILGSTFVAECCKDCHNHRFATVSDVAIQRGNSHVHKIKFRTDSYEGHFHEFEGESGPAIPTGDGRHVHFAKAFTKEADGHKHEFRVVSLIENPIGD
ncbi:MAG: YmaF family protein [Lachnospirales bacterium]